MTALDFFPSNRVRPRNRRDLRPYLESFERREALSGVTAAVAVERSPTSLSVTAVPVVISTSAHADADPGDTLGRKH